MRRLAWLAVAFGSLAADAAYVSFLDPEGNRVSMLEPISVNWHAPKRKAAKKAAQGRKK